MEQKLNGKSPEWPYYIPELHELLEFHLGSFVFLKIVFNYHETAADQVCDLAGMFQSDSVSKPNTLNPLNGGDAF